MKRESITSLGAAVSALLASFCCIGPAVLALAGIGGVGIFALFESWRTPLIAITILLLAAAFFLVYRKKTVVCEDGSCQTVFASTANKMFLWFATLLTVFFIAFPYITLGFSQSHMDGLEKKSGANKKEVIIPVRGMTCTGCNAHIESTVKKIAGVMNVRVDYTKNQAIVLFDGEQTSVDAIVKTINQKTSYKAAVPDSSNN